MLKNLKQLFEPKSIAVIGASNRLHSVGMKVFKNLLKAPFDGRLYAVNPKHKMVQGQHCYASITNIKQKVDLVVISVPAQAVPNIIQECGEKGIKVAIILSSGFSEAGAAGKALEKSMLQIAARYKIRIVGPNCLGVIRPHLNMNASFDNNTAKQGGIALVSQSGAISAAILDWSINKKIGFSALVSIGNCADVDFNDVLDYLATDKKTKSILLYIEGIHHSKKFLASLKRAALLKPIIAIKGGKNQQGSRAALSHTGALVGNDAVFDEALRESGVVRAMTIQELFFAAEILSGTYKKVNGDRLMVITNGGGAGVMAADRASELDIRLPELSDRMVAELNAFLPSQWSRHNPIDIIGDASAERYHSTLDICAKAKDVDAILAILVPVSMANPLKVAEQIIKDAKKMDKLILACWMGEKQVRSSWEFFRENHIPFFDTPEKAVTAFSFLATHQHNQVLLKHTSKHTKSMPKKYQQHTVRKMIDTAISEGRAVLTTLESKAVLKAYHISTLSSITATTAAEAVKAAKKVGFPVVMKINSVDITHKKDAGGVELNISTPAEVSTLFSAMIKRAKKYNPKAKIDGVTLETMLKTPNDRELMIGIMTDNVFGPVITFGAGGTFVEIIKDSAIALPPLNRYLAQHLIERTRISKALAEFRNMPAVKTEKIIDILIHVSALIHDFPEIKEMDINPLIANEKSVTAVDARFILKIE